MHSDILVVKTFKSKEEAKNFTGNLNDLFLKYVRYDYTRINNYIDYTRNYYSGHNSFLTNFKEEISDDNSYLSNLEFKKTEEKNIFSLSLDAVKHKLAQRIENLENYFRNKIRELEPSNMSDLIREIIYELDDNYGGFKIVDITRPFEILESENEFFSRVLKENKKTNNKEVYFIPICSLDYHF